MSKSLSQKVDGLDRAVAASDTFERLKDVGRSLGVTRFADITGLDRIGIPVYTSVVPQSADVISVYNGKGLRPIDAKVGSLMEAIERQTALKTRLPHVEATYAELSRKARTLDPGRINQELSEDFTAESQCAWVCGLDLFSGEECWVPAKLAGYIWDELPHDSPFTISDTTGLASGNNQLEAVCHALCELIERDAWTFAELGSRVLPEVRRQVLGKKGHKRQDDLEHCPCVDVPEGNALLEAFDAADLTSFVRDITSAVGVPTFAATVIDESIFGFPMAHLGFGCHPNADVALRRALTEAAQSRCVDIQGVREDILPPDAPADEFMLHTRRISAVNRNRWTIGESRTRRPFQAIESHVFPSLEADLQFLMERLKAAGLGEAIVVDFTPGCTSHSVVRVIVPGIELWATDHGRLGQRAVDFWKQHA